jgi:DNA-binding response OmpR family regulator
VLRFSDGGTAIEVLEDAEDYQAFEAAIRGLRTMMSEPRSSASWCSGWHPRCGASVAAALAEPNWEVIEAANGRVALDKLRESRLGVVVPDLMMPEMDGFELLAMLQANVDWQHIPVLVVTALDLTDQDRSRLNVGIEKIVSKTHVSARDLVARIKAVLRDSHRATPSPEVVL